MLSISSFRFSSADQPITAAIRGFRCRGRDCRNLPRRQLGDIQTSARRIFWFLITDETPQAHGLSRRRGRTSAVSTTTAGSPQHGQEPHPVSEGCEFA
jgi:hypothetical protein